MFLCAKKDMIYHLGSYRLIMQLKNIVKIAFNNLYINIDKKNCKLIKLKLFSLCCR